MDLTNFQNYLTKEYPKSKTATAYLMQLRQFFKYYNEFSQVTVDDWLTKLSREEKLASRNSFIYAFKSYGKFVGIELNYPASVSYSHKEKDPLTLDEIENEILPYFSRLFSEDWEKRAFVFKFLALSMLRYSEAIALKKQDINFEKGYLTVVHGKGLKNRMVPIHPAIKDDLKKYCDVSPNEYALNIAQDYIKYLVDVINKQLRYKKHITPHLLRHTGATEFNRQGVDLKVLKDILGHSSTDTTDGYIHLTNEDKINAFKKVKYPKRRKK